MIDLLVLGVLGWELWLCVGLVVLCCHTNASYPPGAIGAMFAILLWPGLLAVILVRKVRR